MGPLFYFFTFFSALVSLVIFVLIIASGLFILSELTEEFPKETKKILSISFYFIVFFQFILMLDTLPLRESIIEIIFLIFIKIFFINKLPLIDLNFTNPLTIIILVLFLLTNIMWLRFFLQNIKEYTVLEMIGFFVTIVWAIPISLFVSISANIITFEDNNQTSRNNTKVNLFRSLFPKQYQEKKGNY